MNAVAVNAGIGGLLVAAAKAGYKPAFAVEDDQEAMGVLQRNFPIPRCPWGLLDCAQVPHPEVVLVGTGRLGLLSAFLKATNPRIVVSELNPCDGKMTEILNGLSYRHWMEVLDSSWFGVPQRRKRTYAVAFRADVSAKFISFPFPDPSGSKPLATVLEENPSSSLLLKQATLDGIKRQNERNAKAGFRYAVRPYSETEIGPEFPGNYFKDSRGFLVDSGNGPRRLSVLEAKRLMGFPDEYAIPVCNTSAYRLLGKSPCVPVLEAVLKEVKDWTDY